MVGPGSPVVSTWIAFLYWPALFIRLARLAFTSRVILSCVNFRWFRLSSCRISFSCDFSPQSHYEITSLFVNLLDYCIHYNSYYNTPPCSIEFTCERDDDGWLSIIFSLKLWWKVTCLQGYLDCRSWWRVAMPNGRWQPDQCFCCSCFER